MLGIRTGSRCRCIDGGISGGGGGRERAPGGRGMRRGLCRGSGYGEGEEEVLR